MVGVYTDSCIDSTFQSSSSLLICWAVIWRALSCSCSEGILTSQDRKQRSWMRGCHCELSQLMSFRLLWLAHGCLCYNQSTNVKQKKGKSVFSLVVHISGRVKNHGKLHKSTLTCTVTPLLSQLWQGWSPEGRHCDSHSCSTPIQFPPEGHLYVGSPLWTLLSPGGLQCGYKWRQW